MIRAEITAKSNVSGKWRYAWKALVANTTGGTDVEPLAYRRGTTSINPAVEINNHDVTVGTIVWLQQRGFVGGQIWYEFQYEPGSAIVSSITDFIGGTTRYIAADNTWTQGNYAMSFPSAGNWWVNATITCMGEVSTLGSGGYGRVEVRLWDFTNNVQIGHIVVAVFPQVVNRQIVGTAQINTIYNAPSIGTSYILQGRRVTGDGTVWSSAAIEDVSLGRCWNGYRQFKLG